MFWGNPFDIKLTIKNPDFFDKGKNFNENITNQNKNYDFHLSKVIFFRFSIMNFIHLLHLIWKLIEQFFFWKDFWSFELNILLKEDKTFLKKKEIKIKTFSNKITWSMNIRSHNQCK